MRGLILLLIFLFAGTVNAQNNEYLHDLRKYAKAADEIQPMPHDLYHYCEELYNKDSSETVPNGEYWTLVTDGYGSLEKYTVDIENNAIYELRWQHPHPDTLILDTAWSLWNGVYSYENGYFFIVYKEK